MIFTDVIDGHSNEIQEIMRKLKQLILQTDSDLQEEFAGGAKVKMVYYYIGVNTKVVCLLSPATDHVKVFLHYFDRLELNQIKLQGKGKHSRHFRIKTWDEAVVSEFLEHLQTISNIYKKAAKH